MTTTTDKRSGRRINPTNVDYVRHHIEQSKLSLERAAQRLEELTTGRSGHFAVSLNEVGATTLSAFDALDAAMARTNEISTEIKSLF